MLQTEEKVGMGFERWPRTKLRLGEVMELSRSGKKASMITPRDSGHSRNRKPGLIDRH